MMEVGEREKSEGTVPSCHLTPRISYHVHVFSGTRPDANGREEWDEARIVSILKEIHAVEGL